MMGIGLLGLALGCDSGSSAGNKDSSHNPATGSDAGDGDGDTNAGDGDVTPGDGDSTPGDGDSTPGDGDSTPGDGDSTPGDGDAVRDAGSAGDGDGDVTPGDGDSASDAGSGGDGDTQTDSGTPVTDSKTYYRADTMVIIAPKLYGFVEVTGPVNDNIKTAMTEDKGPMNVPDGNIDLSEFLRFDDVSKASGGAALGGALCKAPLSDAACTPDTTAPFAPVTYTSLTTGACLDVDGQKVQAPCYVSSKQALTVSLGTMHVPLEDAQLAGQLTSETPPTHIKSGVVHGFLTQAAADATNLPSDLPAFAALVGIKAGAPMSSLLHKQDQVKLNGVSGWWLTATYTATKHAFTP
jgi:hypothetical protein